MYLGTSYRKTAFSQQNPSNSEQIKALYKQVSKLSFRVCCINNTVTDGGGGGTPSDTIYPLIITQDDFQSDGVSYDNPAIVGDTLTIFMNEGNQNFLVAGPETFSYTSTGIIINFPGFDANTQTWTIRIEKLNS